MVTKEVISYFTFVASPAAQMRDVLLTHTQNNSFCPPAPNFAGFQDILNKTNILLVDIGDFENEDIVDLVDMCTDSNETFTDVEKSTDDTISASSWQCLVFMIPAAFFFVFLVEGVLLAACNRSTRCFTLFLNWLVLPLFILYVTVCWVASGVLVIMATMNAGQ